MSKRRGYVRYVKIITLGTNISRLSPILTRRGSHRYIISVSCGRNLVYHVGVITHGTGIGRITELIASWIGHRYLVFMS